VVPALGPIAERDSHSARPCVDPNVRAVHARLVCQFLPGPTLRLAELPNVRPEDPRGCGSSTRQRAAMPGGSVARIGVTAVAWPSEIPRRRARTACSKGALKEFADVDGERRVASEHRSPPAAHANLGYSRVRLRATIGDCILLRRAPEAPRASQLSWTAHAV